MCIYVENALYVSSLFLPTEHPKWGFKLHVTGQISARSVTVSYKIKQDCTEHMSYIIYSPCSHTSPYKL